MIRASTGSGSSTCALALRTPMAPGSRSVIAHMDCCSPDGPDRAGRGDRHDQDAPAAPSLSPERLTRSVVSSRPSAGALAKPSSFTAALARLRSDRRSRSDAARPRRPLHAWRQHACEQPPHRVSPSASPSGSNRRTLSSATNGAPAPPKTTRFALYRQRNPDRRWIRAKGVGYPALRALGVRLALEVECAARSSATRIGAGSSTCSSSTFCKSIASGDAPRRRGGVASAVTAR